MTTLEVRVMDNSSMYHYELRGADGSTAAPLEQEHVVEVSRSFVESLCQRIDVVLAQALEGKTDHRAQLAKYGKELYRHLLPSPPGNVPVLVSRLRESTGPFLVRSNEADIVPWELLHDGREFFGLTYDLSRRRIVKRDVMPGRAISRIKHALVVGDTLGDLDAARREAEHVAGWLRDHDAECTVLLGERANQVDVVEELRSDRYDLFHFCGHLADPRGVAGLMMYDRALVNERTLQGLESVPPVVFINGCGADRRGADLCMSFMLKGAKAVVSTRADVAEPSARRFAEEFYQRLLDGDSIGAAVRMARTSLTDEPDAAWASFFLYGDPDARITAGGGTTADGGTPQKHGKRDKGKREHMLDADAQALMDRVYGRAVGVAMSMDLLIGLLETEELRVQIEDTVGAERLDQVTDLLHSLLGGLPRRTTEARAEPSDTVNDVLVRAENRAAADGRAAATVSDIAAAFVDVGGGSAAHVLELCGLSPDQLIPGQSGTTKIPRDRSGPSDSGAADRLDGVVAVALRAALMLAAVKGEELVSSYRLLRGFGLADSQVLRQSLARQGATGMRAFERLSASPAGPPRSGLSKRASQALERARDAAAGPLIGEAAVLRALLADTSGSAHRTLARLGVDVDRLLHDLADDDLPS